jgi:hypothetical protein
LLGAEDAPITTRTFSSPDTKNEMSDTQRAYNRAQGMAGTSYFLLFNVSSHLTRFTHA